MIEKLDMKTPNFTDENIAKIAEIFPNVLTETKDEKGNIKKAMYQLTPIFTPQKYSKFITK